MTSHKAPHKDAAKVKKGQSYTCGICGYRITVDKTCGCAEEHVFICCDKPMTKTAAKKPPKKK